MDFIKVPRSLIYDKELGDKRIIAYSSILFHNWDSKKCDVQELVLYFDYSISRKSTDVDLQFLDLYKRFNTIGYINIHNLIEKTFTFFVEPPKDSFGIIYNFEIAEILDYRKKMRKNGYRINHAHLLLLLSYIRLNMQKQPDKPVMHFSLLKTISKNIGLSVRSITSALKILEELDIIHSEELPRYKDSNGNWHSNVKVFVNMGVNILSHNNTGYDWQIETEYAIKSIIASQRDYIGEIFK